MKRKMKRRLVRRILGAAAAIFYLLLISISSSTAEMAQDWKLINPEGSIQIEPIRVNPHPSTLEGKTIMLIWNGKDNGDLFLNRIAELMKQRVPTVKIIKLWELDKSTALSSLSYPKSKEMAQKVAALKPDIAIASQAD